MLRNDLFKKLKTIRLTFTSWAFGLSFMAGMLTGAGDTLASVSSPAADRYFTILTANKVIKNISYLPFSSKSDGCYARALYMGMELAVNGIPSSNMYIIGKLRPQGAKWSWHVAPAIKLASTDTTYVFDPSLANTPITSAEWTKLSNSQNKPQFQVAPVTHYKMSTVQYYADQRKFGYTRRSQITEFEDLPKFKISDIADACRTAWQHIGKENLTPAQKAAKRQRLVNRTNYLVDKLMEVDKVNDGARIVKCSEARYLPGWEA
jgi:hypothetical protein